MQEDQDSLVLSDSDSDEEIVFTSAKKGRRLNGSVANGSVANGSLSPPHGRPRNGGKAGFKIT